MEELRPVLDNLGSGGTLGAAALLAYIVNWVRKLAPKYLTLLEAKIAKIAAAKALSPFSSGTAGIELQIAGALRVFRVIQALKSLPDSKYGVREIMRMAFPEVNDAGLDEAIAKAGWKKMGGNDETPSG